MILFIPLLFLLVISVHGSYGMNEPKKRSNQSPSNQTSPSKINYSIKKKEKGFDVITTNRITQYCDIRNNTIYMDVDFVPVNEEAEAVNEEAEAEAVNEEAEAVNEEAEAVNEEAEAVVVNEEAEAVAVNVEAEPEAVAVNESFLTNLGRIIIGIFTFKCCHCCKLQRGSSS